MKILKRGSEFEQTMNQKIRFLFQVSQDHPHFQRFTRKNHMTQHIIVLTEKKYTDTRRISKRKKYGWSLEESTFRFPILSPSPVTQRAHSFLRGKMQSHTCDVSAWGILFEISSLGFLLGAGHVSIFCLATTQILDSQT